jgi:hypothetical protein
MGKFYFNIFFLATLILLSCSSHKTTQKQLYTAHNIWNHQGMLYCINYKSGQNIIPAGTPVKDVKIIIDKSRQYIVFRLAETNQKIKMFFKTKWHPGQTIESYADKILTEKNLTELVQGLNPEEIDSIKRGMLTVGMSKRAVLISYGVPPEHFTSSIDNYQWYYWINRTEKKKICFDRGERTIRCDELKKKEL